MTSASFLCDQPLFFLIEINLLANLFLESIDHTSYISTTTERGILSTESYKRKTSFRGNFYIDFGHYLWYHLSVATEAGHLIGGESLDKKAIGQRLIEARGGMSQVQAAKAIGVTRSALSMYETAKRIPNDDIKIKISEVYKVPIQELFFKGQGHASGPVL